MKKRVAGGVVLVAVGIGIWLSNLFNGLGPGGAGTNVGMNPDVAVSLDTSQTSAPAGSTPAEDGPAVSLVTGRPVVVIDGQQYFLEVRENDTAEYHPASLDEIVKLAKSAEADEDGIVMQIKRRGSSRPSAESALDNALQQAEITEEQIQRHAGFVE